MNRGRMNTGNQSLVNQLVGFARVPRVVVTLVVATVLALPLVLAALWRRGHGSAAPLGLWQLAMAPAIIVFVLEVHPWLQRRWQLAIDALRPLVRQPELLDPVFAARRIGEWIALALGAAFAVWISLSMRVSGWLFFYLLTAYIVMFGLMALSIHDGLRRSKQLKRILAEGLTLDLFDRQLLTPLARFGQGISLTFVGGICLSLLFQSAVSLKSVQSLVIYSILIVVALTLFVMSMWSIHAALVAAQARELAIVRAHWSQARAELLRHRVEASGATSADDTARHYEPLVVLGTYERQVLEASTWPFNPKIVKEVVASLVAPILIYGVKVAVGLPGQA